MGKEGKGREGTGRLICLLIVIMCGWVGGVRERREREREREREGV
jgi:hypothetical protein